MSWGNWGNGWNPDRTSRQHAANDFLATGNINTALGGTGCRGSADCASGYVCAGGRCVPQNSFEGPSDGTTAGCGGAAGGGACGELVAGTMTAGSDGFYNYNVGEEIPESIRNQPLQWRANGYEGTFIGYFNISPRYAADGCTITGCSATPCDGGGSNVDCPGERSCRYDGFGTVNCFCGPPPLGSCSVFCTEYLASFGEVSDGCSGLACDECAYCDEIFVSASATCKPYEKGQGAPCHCGIDELQECMVCSENGGTEIDEENCYTCVDLYNQYCPCDGKEYNATCCYTLAEAKDGLTPVNRCLDSVNAKCADTCPPDKDPDPCALACVDKMLCQQGSFPSIPADGPWTQNTVTGQIITGTGYCTLWTECKTDSVDWYKCNECDCNCNNDCDECEICGATGECERDPACDGNFTSTWYKASFDFTYEGCSYNPDTGGGGCVFVNGTGSTPELDVTTSPGPLPHKLVQIFFPEVNPYGPCLTGNMAAGWRVQDANGNWITAEFELYTGIVSGSFCTTADPTTPPTLVSTQSV